MATLTLGTGAKRYVRNFNWTLVVASVAISLIGVLCIQSADLHDPDAAGEFKKQILYIVLGIPLMIGISFVDYQNWKRWAPALYVVNLLLLLFIMRGGHSALGAQRWISLGPLGTFQPSEPAKLVLAISLAAVFCRGSYDNLQDLWKPLLVVGIPALLILKQPDLGTALVLLAMLTVQLFFALPKLGDFAIYILGLLIVAAVAVGTNVILKPFQKARLFVFINPRADTQGAGYNLNQSKIAVGSGEWLGRGLPPGNADPVELRPRALARLHLHRARRRVGIRGAGADAALLRAALRRHARDAGRARPVRLSARGGSRRHALLSHSGQRGMTIGMMPITGIPLPFMSYGGSAILTNFMAVGILLNIYSQRDRDVLGNA